jgi:hypothetical protein
MRAVAPNISEHFTGLPHYSKCGISHFVRPSVTCLNIFNPYVYDDSHVREDMALELGLRLFYYLKNRQTCT